jgi:hypothetical protein
LLIREMNILNLILLKKNNYFSRTKLNKMKNIKEKVLEWAELRNLLHNENALKQYSKLQEESNELLIGILNKDPYEQIDAIGDCAVVLIILAEQLGHDFDRCLESAYNEIKDRKGRTENGNFIKE